MQISSRNKKLFMPISFYLIISMIVVPIASAYDCYEKSPDYANDKTTIEPIKSRKLTRSEQNMLEELFKSLSGEWEGEAENYECRGGENNVSKTQSFFSIKAKVKTDRSGNLRLESDLYSKETRSAYSERMEFYFADNKLRLDTDSAAGDIELLEVSKSTVKYLKTLSGGGGWMVSPRQRRELVVTLSVNTNAFTIETLIFAQGRFISKRIRNFKR